MLTLILVLLLQGASGLWFYRRFKIAEAIRLRCHHDVQAAKFQNTAELMRKEWNDIWDRYEAVEAELKSIKGTLHNHDNWVFHFMDKHDPVEAPRL